jgi:hypothetical protein
VRSTPAGAEVFVDGERRGVTPLTLRDLRLGAHTVRVTRSGYAPAEERLTLDAGRPSRAVELALVSTAQAAGAAGAPGGEATAGSLVVDSRPAGARVLVGGVPVGATPVTLTALRPGDHAVRIERTGYVTINATARVEAGVRTRLAVSLTLERPQ